MTIVEALKTIIFFIFFWFVTIFFGTYLFLNMAAHFLLGRKFPSNQVHQIATGWGRSLFNLTPGWSIQIHGSEHSQSPQSQPAVIVSNHESATDILAFYQLNMQFRWIAKQKIFSLPIIGTAMRAADYVGVERGNKNSHQKHSKTVAPCCALEQICFFSRRVPDQPQALRGNSKSAPSNSPSKKIYPFFQPS